MKYKITDIFAYELSREISLVALEKMVLNALDNEVVYSQEYSCCVCFDKINLSLDADQKCACDILKSREIAYVINENSDIIAVVGYKKMKD